MSIVTQAYQSAVRSHEESVQIPLGMQSANAMLTGDIALLGEYWPIDFTVRRLMLTVEEPPTGSALIVDIRRNGMTVFHAPLRVEAGLHSSDDSILHSLVLDPLYLREGDVVAFRVLQVGAVTPGRYPVVTLFGTRGVPATNPTLFGDDDVLNYIARVESADGQALENATRMAIAQFIRGCKTDGIWDAIKASCILVGARTLSGALVPLKGAAPTNFNFVSGNYNRKTGLKGDGSTKQLNTNRSTIDDPQNNAHISAFITEGGTSASPVQTVIGAYTGTNNSTYIGTDFSNRWQVFNRSNKTSTGDWTIETFGLIGTSRSNNTVKNLHVFGSNFTNSITSSIQTNKNYYVFSDFNSLYGPFRIAFYSIGEAIDLALLNARVSALIAAIGGAF